MVSSPYKPTKDTNYITLCIGLEHAFREDPHPFIMAKERKTNHLLHVSYTPEHMLRSKDIETMSRPRVMTVASERIVRLSYVKTYTLNTLHFSSRVRRPLMLIYYAVLDGRHIRSTILASRH